MLPNVLGRSYTQLQLRTRKSSCVDSISVHGAAKAQLTRNVMVSGFFAAIDMERLGEIGSRRGQRERHDPRVAPVCRRTPPRVHVSSDNIGRVDRTESATVIVLNDNLMDERIGSPVHACMC